MYDLSQIDIDTQLNLWAETFRLRRQIVREQSIGDVLKMFPGYSCSFLVCKLFIHYLVPLFVSLEDFRGDKNVSKRRFG